MSLFVTAILLISTLSPTTSDAGLRGPPHVTNEMPSSYRAKIGDTVRMDCPIDSGPSLQVYYDWKKDGDSITLAWDRFRVTPKKLRIKGVLAEDGGLYVCKGTNGFGSKTLSTRLIVEDENGDVVGGFEGESNRGRENPLNKNFLTDEILGIRRPSFTEITEPPSGSTFRPTKGSTLTLKCHVDGHPAPSVTWILVKDNIQLSKANGEELHLIEIEPSHSGVYICVASNAYGQINASFIVDVIDHDMEGLRILSLDSSNLTATKGDLIHFRCLISSDTFPSIQWLRQLGDDELDSAAGLQMAGVRYKVLGSRSVVSAFDNGTYLSELSLPMEGCAAGIVCLATNSGGYRFETTTVTYVQNSAASESDAALPVAMLFAIPATLLMLVSVLTAAFCCCRKAKGRGNGAVTTATTYATPRDATANDYQAPPVPFYNLRQHSFPTNQFPGNRASIFPPGNNSHFGSQQYFMSSRDSGSPVKVSQPPYHHSSPAYASVPICDIPGNAGPPRPPPLPSRTFPNPSLRGGGDRGGYNTQALMTQPLLTQTGSSSDSRDSRHSGGHVHRGGAEFGSNLPPQSQRQSVDHWCMTSDGSEGSWDAKGSRTHHQIRV